MSNSGHFAATVADAHSRRRFVASNTGRPVCRNCFFNTAVSSAVRARVIGSLFFTILAGSVIVVASPLTISHVICKAAPIGRESIHNLRPSRINSFEDEHHHRLLCPRRILLPCSVCPG